MNFCFKLLTVCLLGLGLNACAFFSSDNQQNVQRSVYVLTEMNGTPFQASKIPYLQFHEGFMVSGAICNSFIGQGELVDGTLFVRDFATTRTLCPDPQLNELEFALGNMLMLGAGFETSGNELTLTGPELVLKFQVYNFTDQGLSQTDG